jgi:Ecdysteroid kinase-like family
VTERQKLALPRSVEGITPEWLTKALSIRHPGVRVNHMNTDTILWGTATKMLVTLEYEYNGNAGDLPRKLCVKGELDEKLREKLKGVSTTGTQIEADFYNDLGPKLGVPLLQHWYAGSEPGMGVLILENLAAAGWQFGKPSEPWSTDLIAEGLEILAVLHASTWGKTFPEIRWLQVGSEVLQEYTEFLISQNHWDSHFSRADVFQLGDYLQDRDRALNALRLMWQYDKDNAICVVHGDTHLGNTCINPDGKPLFLDWAAPCYSFWALDIPYFIVGGMDIDERRKTEKELLKFYLDKLGAHGGPSLDWDQAWFEYRRHLMHGMAWGTLPPEMQPIEYVTAMGSRYGTALEEHDVFRLWGV